MKKFGLFFLFTVTIWSCSNNNSTPGISSEEAEINLPSEFETFYDRFHNDTNYQIEHIIFPLSGLPANADTLIDRNAFRWNREDWKWHRPMDENLSGYDRQWSVVSDDLIIETIESNKAAFGMMRRFARMDNRWMLIYYAAMNPIQK